MRHVLLLCLSVGLVWVCTGCVQRMGELTLASTQPVQLDGVDLDSLPVQRHVTGRSKRFILFVLPLGIPRLQEAMDDALARADGDVLTDVSIRRTAWWFLVGEVGWEVTGNVVKTRNRSDAR